MELPKFKKKFWIKVSVVIGSIISGLCICAGFAIVICYSGIMPEIQRYFDKPTGPTLKDTRDDKIDSTTTQDYFDETTEPAIKDPSDDKIDSTTTQNYFDETTEPAIKDPRDDKVDCTTKQVDSDKPRGSAINYPCNNKFDNTTTNQGHFDQPKESNRSLFKQRKLEQKSLGCIPRLVRIPTTSMLEPTDKIMDKKIHTPYQYVNQCKPIMNYCLGTKNCEPTEDGKRPYKMIFLVTSFFGFQELVERVKENLEHTECKCR